MRASQLLELLECQIRSPVGELAQRIALHDLREGAVDRLGRSPSGEDVSSLSDEVEVEVERCALNHLIICIELITKAYKYAPTSISRG
jgi:hypothetical protein